MRAALNSLTSAQQKTLVFMIGTILMLGVAGWMIYDAGARGTQVRKLRDETRRKEDEARNVQMPSLEDQASWTAQESQLNSVLLTDQMVGQLYEEVTKIANENRLERLGVSTEETVIDTNKQPSPEEAKLLSVGVRRYLVMSVKFQGPYPDVARFLGSVAALQRPVEFQTVDMRRSPPLIDVVVVMHVYKREGA